MREIRTYGLKRGLPHWTIQGGMPYSTATCSECLGLIEGNYEPHCAESVHWGTCPFCAVENVVVARLIDGAIDAASKYSDFQPQRTQRTQRLCELCVLCGSPYFIAGAIDAASKYSDFQPQRTQRTQRLCELCVLCGSPYFIAGASSPSERANHLSGRSSARNSPRCRRRWSL